MKKYVCGVDIGGTKIGTGIVDETGNIVAKVKIPTIASEGRDAIVGRIIESIEKALDAANLTTDDISGIGVISPGPIDSKEGIIINPSNLPTFVNVEIVKILSEKFKTKVKLENDANAAAMGEYLFGSGKGTKNFVYMTVSTGIGGGFVCDGKLYGGTNSNASEIGHHIIDFNGPKCGCGSRGCYEVFASGTAIARFAMEAIENGEETLIKEIAKGRDVKAEDVFKAFKEGDKLAKKLVENEGYYLGIGIVNILSCFNPEIIAIGGGVSNELATFYDKMMETVKKRALGANLGVCKIVKAEASDVGILGAAAIMF